MEPKYKSPDMISDQDIIDAFKATDTVHFSARRNNLVKYRKIGIPGLGWWLPLMKVLPLIGITPEMLLPVMGLHDVQSIEQAKLVGEPLRSRVIAEVKGRQMGTLIARRSAPQLAYDDLGSIGLANDPFIALALVLNKNIEVHHEDGGTGEHVYIFTVYVSGEISVAV